MNNLLEIYLITSISIICITNTYISKLIIYIFHSDETLSVIGRPLLHVHFVNSSVNSFS